MIDPAPRPWRFDELHPSTTENGVITVNYDEPPNRWPVKFVGPIDGRRTHIYAGEAYSRANAELIVRAVNAMGDAHDLLTDLGAYMDSRADLRDGDYGIPEPNEEAVFHARIKDVLAKLEVVP